MTGDGGEGIDDVDAVQDVDDVLSFGAKPTTRRRWAAYASAGILVVALIVAAVVLGTGNSPGSRGKAAGLPTRASEVGSESPSSGGGELSGESGPSAALSGQAGPSDAPGAANLWSGFPVDAAPRPIVLLGEDNEAPARGFVDGDAKLAFMAGQLRWDIDRPSAPATSGGYPVITAQQAIDRFRPAEATKMPETTKVLGITQAELTTHEFMTDRGPQTLPAWRFRITDSTGDAYVLAIAPSARYSPPAQSVSYFTDHAAISSGGRSVTIRFVARYDSNDPCDPPYTSSLDIVQTKTAVVLAVTRHDLPLPTPTNTDIACGLVGRGDSGPVTPGAPGTRTVKLDEPLGARVLVDVYGRPYQVTR